MDWLNTLKPSKVNEQPTVAGMTILKDRMYVIYQHLSTMEVYDCKTNAFIFRKQVVSMIHPKDIASCPLFDCLYILNTLSDFISMKIIRIDSSKAVTMWDVPSESCQISVFEGNIIVSLFSNIIPEIKEYDCHGSLIRTVTLQMSTELFNSWQVLKITNECYVCFLSYLGANTITIDLFLLTNDGEKLKSLKSVINKEDHEFEVNQKLLAIDVNRNIIFFDSPEKKFLFFDSNLENREETPSQLIMPDIIALDESSEHLFALNKHHASVQVFSLKKQSTEKTHRKDSGPKAADVATIPSSVETSVSPVQ